METVVSLFCSYGQLELLTLVIGICLYVLACLRKLDHHFITDFTLVAESCSHCLVIKMMNSQLGLTCVSRGPHLGTLV